MESFEDLGLGPELVEALAAEGIERPTPFQEAALPVIRRGNNVVGAAGPGAGTLVAYGAGLLDRLEPGEPGTRALVIVPFAEGARRLAISLGRVAALTGHAVAALGSPWALPDRAQILFASPSDLLDHIGRSALELDGVQALVVDGATTIQSVAGAEALEAILESVPADAQRVALSLPLTAAVEDLAERHIRRAVHVPPRAVEERRTDVPSRGNVGYRVVDEPKDEDVVALVSELLDSGEVRHAALFVRSEDRAADLGDRLTLHGYVAGAPGDGSLPVWLAVDELEALSSLEEADDLAVVSVDVPAGPDALDRRHGAGRGGIVLVLPRELAHLKDVAVRTGYRLTASPPPGEERVADDLVDTLERLETALGEEDVGAYLLVLETLFERHDPAEVAAAAVALLRKKTRGGAQGPAPSRATASGPTPWIRLFMSVGRRDDAGPGDIVGAITGEARVDAAKVGRIDMKDTFSIVEVDASVAEAVIGAVNGTSVKGRSVRVDYDRAGGGKGHGGGGGRRRPPGPGRGARPG